MLQPRLDYYINKKLSFIHKNQPSFHPLKAKVTQSITVLRVLACVPAQQLSKHCIPDFTTGFQTL